MGLQPAISYAGWSIQNCTTFHRVLLFSVLQHFHRVLRFSVLQLFTECYFSQSATFHFFSSSVKIERVLALNECFFKGCVLCNVNTCMVVHHVFATLVFGLRLYRVYVTKLVVGICMPGHCT